MISDSSPKLFSVLETYQSKSGKQIDGRNELARALVGVGRKTQDTAWRKDGRYDRVKVSGISAEIIWLEEQEHDERIGEKSSLSRRAAEACCGM